MAEYIEREALINWAKEFYPNDKHFVSGIMNAPAADVVEVVRCRDCKHLSENRFFCKYYNIAIIDNGFCYRGTRMDGETE